MIEWVDNSGLLSLKITNKEELNIWYVWLFEQ
jgi:hypothetical protein